MFDWILGVIEASGYGGIFFLMVLENIFPPIPSEIVIPVSGYAAGRGDMNIFLVILVASLSSLAGSLPWYFLGKGFGIERLKKLSNRFGRLLTLTPGDIDGANRWFQKHGAKAVLIGRLIPAVRTLISVPAGFAKMPLLEFLMFSFIGILMWTSLLAGLGYILGTQYDKVYAYVDPVSNVIIAVIILTYIYRVITFKKD